MEEAYEHILSMIMGLGPHSPIQKILLKNKCGTLADFLWLVLYSDADENSYHEIHKHSYQHEETDVLNKLKPSACHMHCNEKSLQMQNQSNGQRLKPCTQM